ncbi:MAG: type II toxin-antitoxin system YafQ family toxin [Prevotella sp.]|nr:type II toxin-antitoxin system YafQ family toxin [Prevotella sp.]
MKNVRLSGRFKKDVKRYKHKDEKLKKLFKIVEMLRQDKQLPPENEPHMLHGQYKGCMECHIEDDFLLIWIDEMSNTIKLLRLGTHHELFGK